MTNGTGDRELPAGNNRRDNRNRRRRSSSTAALLPHHLSSSTINFVLIWRRRHTSTARIYETVHTGMESYILEIEIYKKGVLIQSILNQELFVRRAKVGHCCMVAMGNAVLCHGLLYYQQCHLSSAYKQLLLIVWERLFINLYHMS